MRTSSSRTEAQAQPALTLVLARQAQQRRWDALPEDVRELARQCLLDWLGVALAGSRAQLVERLLAQADAEGGHAIATVPGRGRRIAPLQAALVNGTASHVLDYDDVNTGMHGHASAPILGALLPLAQQRRASGSALLAAFVAGYELACRAGQSVSPGHYERGYHATASVGVLGAAAACAHLLQLDPERTAHALGVAATQAAGLRSMFGTECKPLHAGLASQAGLRAAQLAELGIVARADALECRVGWADTLAPAFDPRLAQAEPERFHIRDNLFKYHASCYGTHATIECLRRLREQGLQASEVERVIVRGERGQETICNIAEPRTGLEAKFSLRFAAAAALAGSDTADPAFFSAESAADPRIVALRDRVRVELGDGWNMVQSEVVVETRDGRVLREIHDAGVPASDVAAQGARLANKFERLAQPVLGKAAAHSLLALVAGLEHGTAEELMEEAAGTAAEGA